MSGSGKKKARLRAARRAGARGGGVYDPPTYEHLHQHGDRAITHLLNSTPEQIARYDVAEMNLVCAYGLPGTKGMDVADMLHLLDVWARRVGTFTHQHWRLYTSGRSGARSAAQFRLVTMFHVITREFGVRYNPERLADPDDFSDAADSFLHGILSRRRMGTCASLPVLFVALGRRLGYPLTLVESPGHLFFRWESPRERFNAEFHDKGLNVQDDDHYRRWPWPWPAELIRREARDPTYLVSLTPTQTLSNFALNRALFLIDIPTRRFEALETMRAACRLWKNHRHDAWLKDVARRACRGTYDIPPAIAETRTGSLLGERVVTYGLPTPEAPARPPAY
ncbi:MAG: transglutaminase family protein [Planctomycetota bacterium]